MNNLVDLPQAVSGEIVTLEFAREKLHCTEQALLELQEPTQRAGAAVCSIAFDDETALDEIYPYLVEVQSLRKRTWIDRRYWQKVVAELETSLV